ncbi:RDD family protein [Enterococcus sp. AZ194]|uniref:RDD family protein n=1 Tax=Enterococcus sp. AZ194 TaxID=2774629 RepID=UPI003F682B93
MSQKSINPSEQLSTSAELENKQTTAKRQEPLVGPNQESVRTYNEQKNKTAYTKEEIQQKQEAWHSFSEEPRTTQIHDFPGYFYAGFWIRGFAFLIDLLCIQAINSISLGTIFSLAGWSKDKGFLSVYSLMSLLIYLGYFILLTKMTNGQTIGKMIFGIRVVSFEEDILSWQTVLVREGACRFILKYPALLLGYLPTIFSKKKQHVGDYFSATSVVTINTVLAFNKKLRA